MMSERPDVGGDVAMSDRDIQAIRERAQQWGENRGIVSSMARDVLALLADREACVCELKAERDAADETIVVLSHRLAERKRKVEAYDAARAQVKREGFSRAEYVLRAEAAESDRAALLEAAKAAKSQAAAPDYDEEAIRDSLWALVDLALARLSSEDTDGSQQDSRSRNRPTTPSD